MADKDKFAGLPHVKVEDFSDRDFLRIQEDVQRAEAHEHNVETGSYERETDDRGFDDVDHEGLQKAVARVLKKRDNDVEDHTDPSLGVEEAVADSAAAQEDPEDRVEAGPAKDSPVAIDEANEPVAKTASKGTRSKDSTVGREAPKDKS